MREVAAPPCSVLDIGSHYLHQGAVLARMGYEVTGIDVPLFTEAPMVMARAQAFGIRNVAVDAIDRGEFLPGEEGRYGLVVFTEILEHITFNPVRFWRRVHALLAPRGIVYLSTPNSLRPAAWLRAQRDLLRLRGRGLEIDDILATVTYGHHWKEYSAREIHRYFALLSTDFSVSTQGYSTDLDDSTGLAGRVKRLLARVPAWRSDIEAVIRLEGHAGFAAAPPALKIQAGKARQAAMQEAPCSK
jgi:2-polyprenyl-3-methyl-5-hydroxy-6-metoxy-1,4-benzoquinol methylase